MRGVQGSNSWGNLITIQYAEPACINKHAHNDNPKMLCTTRNLHCLMS